MQTTPAKADARQTAERFLAEHGHDDGHALVLDRLRDAEARSDGTAATFWAAVVAELEEAVTARELGGEWTRQGPRRGS
jgi:hypothetical protein